VVLTVATVGVLENQRTALVKSAVLESLYLPMAVNWCVNPLGTLALAGVISTETRVGGADDSSPPQETSTAVSEASTMASARWVKKLRRHASEQVWSIVASSTHAVQTDLQCTS
jgi:hypothetical protein